MCSRAWQAQCPGFKLYPERIPYQRIISNNSYVLDEQGDNQHYSEVMAACCSLDSTFITYVV